MRKAFFYLDQNILSYIENGRIVLPSISGIDWIYSDEHFREIARGRNDLLLSVLKDLKARQIHLLSPDGRANEACIDEYCCPRERYQQYLLAIDEVPLDEAPLLEFLARLNGASNFAEVSLLPEKLLSQVDKILELTPLDASPLKDAAKKVASNLSELISTKLDRAVPLEKSREYFGTDRGRAGQFQPPQAICEVWKIIQPHVAEISMDQFFWFEPFGWNDSTEASTFYRIISYHMMLNIVGYQVDAGINDPTCLPAILSDGRHIAYAAFCDALISADRRLCAKAKAIYSYRNITTEVAQLTFKAGSAS